MRVRIAGILGMLGLLAAPLAAQGRVEVGTQGAGFTHLAADEAQSESTLSRFDIPGGGLLGRPTLWATIFVSQKVAIEPHFSYQFRRDHDLDENVGTVGVSLRPVWYAGDPRRASFYAFADASLDRSRQLEGSRNDPSDTDFGFGAGPGHRWSVGDRFGLRVEGLYRFWVDDRRHEIAVNLGLGVVAKRR